VSSPASALGQVIAALDRLEIPYFIGGSVARQLRPPERRGIADLSGTRADRLSKPGLSALPPLKNMGWAGASAYPTFIEKKYNEPCAPRFC
jgi:hypothetical protein